MTTKNAGQVRCGGVAPGQETGPDCPRPTGRLTHIHVSELGRRPVKSLMRGCAAGFFRIAGTDGRAVSVTEGGRPQERSRPTSAAARPSGRSRNQAVVSRAR